MPKYQGDHQAWDGAADSWATFEGPIDVKDRHGKLVDRFTVYVDTDLGIVISQKRKDGRPVSDYDVGEVVKVVELYAAPLEVVSYPMSAMVPHRPGDPDQAITDPAVPLAVQPGSVPTL